MSKQVWGMAIIGVLVLGLFTVGVFDHSDISNYVTMMGGIIASIVSVFVVHEKVSNVQEVNKNQSADLATIKTQTNGVIKAQFENVHAKIDALADAVSKAVPKVEPPSKTAEVVARVAPKPVPVRGCDVSGYQADDFPVAGLSFAFVKATESTGYMNPRAVAQLAWARKHDLVVGLYHYLHHGNIVAQAQYFIAKCKALGVKAGDLLFVDWEDEATTQVDRNQFMALVMKAFPHNRVGLYCNKDFWFNRDTQNYAGDFLFIAAPSDPMGKPGIKDHWTFHQYSSANGLDHDVANFKDKAALVAWANGGDH